MRLTSRLARSLAREDGVAIIVATGVLLVLGLFSAVVATTASSLNDSSVNDRHSKRAFAAAEAGVRYASYLLTEQGAALCTTPLGSTTVGQIPGNPAGGAYCAPQSKNLGNNTRFETFVTPELGTLGTSLNECAGLALSPLTVTHPAIGTRAIPFRQQCVLSYGFSGDQVRRVRMRVAALTEQQLFKVGLTGRERTCIASGTSPCDALAGQGPGRSLVLSDVGSDKHIDTGASVTCGTLYTATGSSSGGDCDRVFPPVSLPLCSSLPTGSTTSCTLSTYTCPNTVDPDPDPPCAPGRETANPQPIPEVLPLFRSARRTRCVAASDLAACLANGTLLADADTKTTNNNDTLNAQIAPVCGGPGTYYSSTPANPRVLDLRGCTGGQTVRLSPGTYNFCRVRFPNNLQFGASTTATPTDPVIIMLDSIYRAMDRDNLPAGDNDEGECGNTNFDFIQGNNSALVSPDPLALQIYAYGNPACTATGQTCSHKIHLQNSGRLAAGIFAPDSQLLIENSGTTGGGGGGGTGDCVNDIDTSNQACEMVGAFYARWLDIGRGFEFTEDARFRTIVTPVQSLGFNRSAWRECSPTPTGTTIDSGC